MDAITNLRNQAEADRQQASEKLRLELLERFQRFTDPQLYEGYPAAADYAATLLEGLTPEKWNPSRSACVLAFVGSGRPSQHFYTPQECHNWWTNRHPDYLAWKAQEQVKEEAFKALLERTLSVVTDNILWDESTPGADQPLLAEGVISPLKKDENIEIARFKSTGDWQTDQRLRVGLYQRLQAIPEVLTAVQQKIERRRQELAMEEADRKARLKEARSELVELYKFESQAVQDAWLAGKIAWHDMWSRLFDKLAIPGMALGEPETEWGSVSKLTVRAYQTVDDIGAKFSGLSFASSLDYEIIRTRGQNEDDEVRRTCLTLDVSIDGLDPKDTGHLVCHVIVED